MIPAKPVTRARGDWAAENAIEVTGLSKIYKSGRRQSKAALADISFGVRPGHTTAIVGESGAGKSTLVRCIAGLEAPSRGRVLIDGAPLKLRPGRTSRVQMVFQNAADALDPMRSIGSSIAEPLRHLDRAGRKQRVGQLLSSVGLDPARARERPRAFSGGQLQRVGIARALAPSPDVLLCDEPTSALDVSVQAQIINLVLELQAEHGFAAVLVTHDLAVARALADDILVLRRGRMLFHGTAADLLDPEAPLEDYVAGLVAASRESELPKPPARVLEAASDS